MTTAGVSAVFTRRFPSPVFPIARRSHARPAHRERFPSLAANEKVVRERETAAARIRHPDRLAGNEPRLWSEVERLAATKLPKSYDQIVVHLVDLRELAAREGRDGCTDFANQLERFRASHARKPSLLDRLDRAAL